MFLSPPLRHHYLSHKMTLSYSLAFTSPFFSLSRASPRECLFSTFTPPKPSNISLPIRGFQNRKVFPIALSASRSGISERDSDEEVCLPQNSTNPEARQLQLEEARQAYIWTQEGGIGNASLIESIPDSEMPNIKWKTKVFSLASQILANNEAIEKSKDTPSEEKPQSSRVIKSDFNAFQRRILTMIKQDVITKEEVACSVKQFSNLINKREKVIEEESDPFQKYKDQFIVIPLPDIATDDKFLEDHIFGWFRIAGPNPMRLNKLEGSATEMFPELTDAIFQGIPHFNDDTLEDAATDGRLFFVDYSELDGVPTGNFVDGSPKTGFYNYAPRALFAVPLEASMETSLLPIAIRTGQDRASYPMYTANQEYTDDISWLAAKLTVQVSDAVTHETMYHLGRTHLLLEVMVCASHRCLAENHPLMKLLAIHFEGTAFINNAATTSLINPGGTIDIITAPQIETTQQISASSINDPSFSFNDWMPQKELSSRGVMGGNINYPYRDDALSIWDAIKNWVTAYLGVYYKSDSDIANDSELARWCEEIVSPDMGNLHGFGDASSDSILSMAYLIEAVTMIIFTASAQHAAVNFPQGTIMKFSPAMPLGGYSPVPPEQPFDTIENLVSRMYPSTEDRPFPTGDGSGEVVMTNPAQEQLNTAHFLGTMVYTKLGDYGRALDFADVETEISEFQTELNEISLDIQTRNAEEMLANLPTYHYLNPDNIPQSINI